MNGYWVFHQNDGELEIGEIYTPTLKLTKIQVDYYAKQFDLVWAVEIEFPTTLVAWFDRRKGAKWLLEI